jgi:hypothetical protein
MKSFKEFNIKTEVEKKFTGDKIKIAKILNREITVLDYKIEPSNYKGGNGMRLVLWIEIEGTKRIVFTGAQQLQKSIEEVPKADIPFKATIIEEDEQYLFS